MTYYAIIAEYAARPKGSRMSNAATYQCPNCNGVLAYNVANGRLECAFCGGSFDEGEVEQALPIDSSVTVQAAPHVETVEEFLDNAPWEIEHEGTAAAMTTVRHSCPSCGAGIVADQSTISTSCPYCGNKYEITSDDWALVELK